jgi:integrase
VFRFTDGRTPGGERLITVDAVGHRVVRLAKRAGVRLTMQSLRKGFGCRYAGKVSAHVLQRLMRHSDIHITMDYYANIDDAVEDAVFGPERNSSCNTAPPAQADTKNPLDATPYENGSGAQPSGLGSPNQ